MKQFSIMLLTLLIVFGCNSQETDKSKNGQQEVQIKIQLPQQRVEKSVAPSDIGSMTLDVNSSTVRYVNAKPFTHSGSTWSISLPALPTGETLTFTAKAYSANGELLLRGVSTRQLIPSSPNTVNIPLIPPSDIEQRVPTLRSMVFTNIDKTEILFTVENPNKDIITYNIMDDTGTSALFNPNNGALSFTNGTLQQLKVTYTRPPDVGTYSYHFYIQNTNGDIFITKFTITISPTAEDIGLAINFPPTINSIGVSNNDNNLSIYSFVSDDSNDTISYLWDVVDGSVSIVGDINNSSVALTNYETNSSFRIKLTASDAHGASSSVIFNVGKKHITRMQDFQFMFEYDTGTKTELWKINSLGNPQFVKVIDANNTSGKSVYIIYDYTILDGMIYFGTNDGLWKSDGTSSGTKMVKGLNRVGEFNNMNGTLYFGADDGTDGVELWKSDGTSAGTVMVKDINPSGDTNPYELTNMNGTLYFATYPLGELWSSDGTSTGTKRVKDINPSGNSSPSELTNINGTLYFTANDGVNGNELWKSDGTEIGTIIVKDINPSGSSDSRELTNINGTLYFHTYNETDGNELWKSDGNSSTTVIIKDINPGNSGSWPYNLTNINGTLYFNADNGTDGKELWKSDGNSSTTVPVRLLFGDVISDPHYLKNANGTLYFFNGTETNATLWKRDGTGINTLKDSFQISFANSYYRERSEKTINNKLYFLNKNNTELWKSNGTEAGTVKIFPLP